jgi:hypothetical protein
MAKIQMNSLAHKPRLGGNEAFNTSKFKASGDYQDLYGAGGGTALDVATRQKFNMSATFNNSGMKSAHKRTNTMVNPYMTNGGNERTFDTYDKNRNMDTKTTFFSHRSNHDDFNKSKSVMKQRHETPMKLAQDRNIKSQMNEMIVHNSTKLPSIQEGKNGKKFNEFGGQDAYKNNNSAIKDKSPISHRSNGDKMATIPDRRLNRTEFSNFNLKTERSHKTQMGSPK